MGWVFVGSTKRSEGSRRMGRESMMSEGVTREKRLSIISAVDTAGLGRNDWYERLSCPYVMYMLLKWTRILWQAHSITKVLALHEVIPVRNNTLFRHSITFPSSCCMMTGVVNHFMTILPAKFYNLFSRGKRVPKTVNNGMKLIRCCNNSFVTSYFLSKSGMKDRAFSQIPAGETP